MWGGIIAMPFRQSKPTRRRASPQQSKRSRDTRKRSRRKYRGEKPLRDLHEPTFGRTLATLNNENVSWLSDLRIKFESKKGEEINLSFSSVLRAPPTPMSLKLVGVSKHMYNKYETLNYFFATFENPLAMLTVGLETHTEYFHALLFQEHRASPLPITMYFNYKRSLDIKRTLGNDFAKWETYVDKWREKKFRSPQHN
jgi:hypothetical protein